MTLLHQETEEGFCLITYQMSVEVQVFNLPLWHPRREEVPHYHWVGVIFQLFTSPLLIPPWLGGVGVTCYCPPKSRHWNHGCGSHYCWAVVKVMTLHQSTSDTTVEEGETVVLVSRCGSLGSHVSFTGTVGRPYCSGWWKSQCQTQSFLKPLWQQIRASHYSLG